jgi:hypothetical protein
LAKKFFCVPFYFFNTQPFDCKLIEQPTNAVEIESDCNMSREPAEVVSAKCDATVHWPAFSDRD